MCRVELTSQVNSSPAWTRVRLIGPNSSSVPEQSNMAEALDSAKPRTVAVKLSTRVRLVESARLVEESRVSECTYPPTRTVPDVAESKCESSLLASRAEYDHVLESEARRICFASQGSRFEASAHAESEYVISYTRVYIVTESESSNNSTRHITITNCFINNSYQPCLQGRCWSSTYIFYLFIY